MTPALFYIFLYNSAQTNLTGVFVGLHYPLDNYSAVVRILPLSSGITVKRPGTSKFSPNPSLALITIPSSDTYIATYLGKLKEH